jgi:hypothetical protein
MVVLCYPLLYRQNPNAKRRSLKDTIGALRGRQGQENRGLHLIIYSIIIQHIKKGDAAMLNNFKVSVRLGAGFGFVLFMLVLMMLIGINRMQSIQEKLETIANRDMAILETVGAMQNASMQQAVLVRDLLSYEDLALQKQAFQKL